MFIGQSSPLTYTLSNVQAMYIAMIKTMGSLLGETDVEKVRLEYDMLLGMETDVIDNTSKDILDRLAFLRNQFDLKRKSVVTHMWKLSGSPRGEEETDWIKLMREKAGVTPGISWIPIAIGAGAVALMFT